MKFLMPDPLSQKTLEELEELGSLTTDVSEADVLVVNKTPITSDILERATNLKLIVNLGSATMDMASCQKLGITIKSAKETNIVAVAENVVTKMLYLLKNMDSAPSARNFMGGLQEQTEVAGRTVGIIGYNDIAKEVAKRARAFEMGVIAFDPFAQAPDMLMVDFDYLLTNADVVVINMPLTRHSKGIVNRTTINKMKHNAVLINTGHDSTIVEADLANALANQRISFARVEANLEEQQTLDRYTKTVADHVRAYVRG